MGGLELDGEHEAKEASIAVECNNVHQVGDVVGRMIIIGGYHTPSSVGITTPEEEARSQCSSARVPDLKSKLKSESVEDTNYVEKKEAGKDQDAEMQLQHDKQ